MKKERFDKAVELYKQIDELTRALLCIEDAVTSSLSYLETPIDLNLVRKYRPLFRVENEPNALREILDRHDAEIRKELQAKIAKLQNEIARL
jgi:uncharacterized Fe-S radical SAM superfamily protein PflX